MTTLLRPRTSVYTAPTVSPEPDPIDDLDWLNDEAFDLDASPGSIGAGEVSAAAIREAMGHLHDCTIAAFGRESVGDCYDDIRPDASLRRTALASALDATAAWYGHLGHAPARFAAAAIQAFANHADNLGSRTAREFEADDAMYEMELGRERDEALAEMDADARFEECERRGCAGHPAEC